MSRASLLVFLICLSPLQPASAQEKLALQIAKLQEKVVALTAENQELRIELKKLRPTKEVSGDLGELLSEQSDQIRAGIEAVKAEKQLGSLGLELQSKAVRELESEIRLLKLKREDLFANLGGPVDAVVAEANIAQLAKVRIENRLRQLEAVAMLEQFQKQRLDRKKELEDRSNVEAAVAALEVKRATYERAKKLVSEGIVSRQELLQEEAGLKQAEFLVRQAELELRARFAPMEDRIAETAVEIAVCQAIQDEVESELAQSKSLLEKAGEAKLLDARLNALNEKFMALEFQKRELKLDMQRKEQSKQMLLGKELKELEGKWKRIAESKEQSKFDSTAIQNQIEALRQELKHVEARATSGK
ncbi:MAG: hypothetical protein AB8B50_06410 [Pirellulaceae bacterium]